MSLLESLHIDVKSGWRRLKPSFFIIYLAPSGAKYLIYWDMEGRFLLRTYWARRLCWPPAGKFWISGIQKVETLILKILDLNLSIFDKIGHNSPFTGSVGRIIDSSRSGTCFSSCLASSIYFSIRKKYVFLGYNFLLWVDTQRPNSFLDPAV